MSANAGLLELMGPELELLLPELDERARRLTLGAVARAAGDGGITAVAKMAGASWQTVADGAAELGSGQVAPEGRIRRPGGGRKKLAGADPGLVPATLDDPGVPGAQECGDEIYHSGKVCEIVYDCFGDLQGFVLETCSGKQYIVSHERCIGDLAIRACKERMWVVVYMEKEGQHRIRRIILSGSGGGKC